VDIVSRMYLIGRSSVPNAVGFEFYVLVLPFYF